MDRDALITLAAVSAAFAGRSEHDVSVRATDFWDNTSNDGKDRYVRMAEGAYNTIAPAIRADERAACIALVYGHAGSDNDAERIVRAIKARGEPTP